jgi:hypothetical protein
MDLNIKFERGFIKPDKKSLLILGIIFLIAVLVLIGLFYYFSREPEITTQESPEDSIRAILRSLSASDPGEPISEEMQESLSSSSNVLIPSSEEEEDILKSLTAPE